jgi:hypothetical protein
MGNCDQYGTDEVQIAANFPIADNPGINGDKRVYGKLSLNPFR